MPAVSEAVKVLSVECGVPEMFVSQVSRNLLNSGTLPKSVGRRVAQVDEKDVSMLLLGTLTADPYNSTFTDAPDRASQYARLKREGEEGRQTFLDFLVGTLRGIRNRRDHHVTFNDRMQVPHHQLRIEIITSYPLVIVSTVPDFRRRELAIDAKAGFAETPQLVQFWPSSNARNAWTVTGDTLFEIVNRLFGFPDPSPEQ